MYVYLRLLKTLILGLIRPKIRFSDQALTAMRVWPNDLDFNFHLNNGRYLTLMDIGRFDLSLRCGLLSAVFRRGWLPVLATASIQFYRSLAPFQRFQISTQIVHWDDKWLYILQGFHSDGNVYATALVKAVFKKGKFTVPVRDLFEFVGEEFFLPDDMGDITSLAGLERALEHRRRVMRDVTKDGNDRHD